MASEIHVGVVGLIFRATIEDQAGTAVNVATATTKQLKFEKPDGTDAAKTAAFYTDGTDGIIQYTTEAGDIDLAGDWKVQAYVVTSTRTLPTSIHSFTVKGNIY
jgi:hypothetical protein